MVLSFILLLFDSFKVGVGDYTPSSALSRGVVVFALVVGFMTMPLAISHYLDTCHIATTATLVRQRQGQDIAAKVLQRMARKAQARRNLRSFVERTFVRDFVEEVRTEDKDDEASVSSPMTVSICENKIFVFLFKSKRTLRCPLKCWSRMPSTWMRAFVC
jgi:hypothetical protein